MDSCAGVNPAQLWPALEHLFQLQNAPVLVRGGKLPLADAQRCIASNWVECWEKQVVVLSQNLDPDILMMQPTQNCDACDAAELLGAPKIRRFLVQ